MGKATNARWCHAKPRPAGTLWLRLRVCVAQVLRLGGSDPEQQARTRRALIIVASQKTLPVAMAVLARYR